MNFGSNNLPLVHPARKYFELLYIEHLENRKVHNSYKKDGKKIKKYSMAKAGVNRNGVHSTDWITDVLSNTFVDGSFLAFLKPLINDKGYDRKPVLPDKIDLEYTIIPKEAYQICNSKSVRAFVDVLILGYIEDERITQLLKEFDGHFDLDAVSIARYKYFFFNIPGYLIFRKRIYEFMQDIAKIDPEFKRNYQSQLSLLSGEAEVEDALNRLGYEDKSNSYERRALKKNVDRITQEIDNLLNGGKSESFGNLANAIDALKQFTGTYIAMKAVLKSDPVITDTVVKAPLQSDELFELNTALQKEIYFDRR
ncbi:MAG: hypothetical protein IID03_12100, partial [Candidatus Dadabacteria bacterium]|nr:hypothetical protein [Candidatus Dadabacteria bacterium]